MAKSASHLTAQQLQEQHREILQKLHRTGSLDYARHRAAEHIEKAEQNLTEARHAVSSELDRLDNNEAESRQGIWQRLSELTTRVIA